MNAYITYDDLTNGRRRKSIRYERANVQSFAVACRELADAIGQHAVDKLTFLDLKWTTPGVDVMFDAVPAYKYAQDVVINMQKCSQAGGNPEDFMRNFAWLKSLCLNLDYDTFREFGWAFLRHESARDLQRIKFSGLSDALSADVNSSLEELVRCCATLPRLLNGEALDLDFSDTHFMGPLALRIIELLKDSGRELTFRMRTYPSAGDLTLDESEYAAVVDGSTIRYTSVETGIVVEVNGRSITIQSAGRTPPTKRSRRNE